MPRKRYLVFVLVVFCCLSSTWIYYISMKWLSIDFISNAVKFSHLLKENNSRQINRNWYHEGEPNATGGNMYNQYIYNATEPTKHLGTISLGRKNVNNQPKQNATFLQKGNHYNQTYSPADWYDRIAAKIRNNSLDNPEQRLKFDDATLIPVRIFDKQVLLYTAILSNTSTPWDTLLIQGWENWELADQGYFCCIKYPSGTIRKTPVSRKFRKPFKVPYLTKQFFCNLSRVMDLQKELPVAVTLIPNRTRDNCPNKDSVFVNIEYAYKHPGKLAVYAKVIYGNLSAVDLLAWFEIHRLMGADMFVFYVYRINDNVTKVLRYYQILGIAKLIPFMFLKSNYAYYLSTLHINDEVMTLSDVFERLQGYKYILHIDIDEYLVPTKNENLPSMFDRLSEWYPDAAGFIFGTYLYITDWGQTSDLSLFKVGQYLNRTTLIKDRVKHFILPTRVMRGHYKSHMFKPKTPFRRYEAPASEAVVRHYRRCRTSYLDTDAGCYDFKRFTDDRVYRLLKPIEKRVLHLKQQLGI